VTAYQAKHDRTQGQIKGKSDQGKGLCARAVWITAGQRNEQEAKIEPDTVKHPSGIQNGSLTASMEQ